MKFIPHSVIWWIQQTASEMNNRVQHQHYDEDDDNHSNYGSWVHQEEMTEEPTAVSITPLLNKLSDMKVDLQQRIRPT